jgi:hypothetical protein
MPSRVQSLRSAVKNTRPGAGTREPGELYVNFPDRQVGFIDASKNPQDLVAVRFFSTTTNYSAGDFVWNAGKIYKAKNAVNAGAFNAADWDSAATVGDYEPPIALGLTTQYWRGDKSWQTLDKFAVGLGNVDNTSDANKPVSTAQAAALALKANLIGPTTFTGTISAPTAAAGSNDGTVATSAYVKGQVATSDAARLLLWRLKADLASPTFTGDPKGADVPAPGDDTSINDCNADDADGGRSHGRPGRRLGLGRKNNLWATVIGGAHTDDNPPPAPLQDGQLWWDTKTGNLNIWYVDVNSAAWIQINNQPAVGGTAESRNRIVNGAMQISQENGNSPSASSGTPSYYTADQFVVAASVAPGVVVTQRLQIVTPKGSQNRIRVQVNTAKAAFAAGDYLLLQHMIEGIRLSDFGWGAAGAKQAVLRFGFKGPAGTYSVSMVGATHAYIANFTIAAGQANTDTEQVLVIPGSTAGTWPAMPRAA